MNFSKHTERTIPSLQEKEVFFFCDCDYLDNIFRFLGQVHRRKIALPNLNSNPNPKPIPNLNRGAIFIGGNSPEPIFR